MIISSFHWIKSFRCSYRLGLIIEYYDLCYRHTYLSFSTIFVVIEFSFLIYFRTPLSSSTSHSGDKLYNSENLKGTNENLSINSYRRKYIANKKPGIKPASHFTERCKTSAPACRTRSLHYLTPKVRCHHFYDIESCTVSLKLLLTL